MVSNASDDLPEPDRPVITTSLCRGMSTSIFLRLWSRAPRTLIHSWAIRGVRSLGDGARDHAISDRSMAGREFVQVFRARAGKLCRLQTRAGRSTKRGDAPGTAAGAGRRRRDLIHAAPIASDDVFRPFHP